MDFQSDFCQVGDESLNRIHINFMIKGVKGADPFKRKNI
jgi:hypothetical protein